MPDESKDVFEEIKEDMFRLSNRWQSESGQAMLASVVSALQLKQPWAHFLANLPAIKEVFTGWDLRAAPIGSVNLSGADFKETQSEFINLRGANLEYTDFRGAELVHADLSESNLVGANFEGCIMGFINLTKANLFNAQLAGAFLAGGNLVEANFSGANLTGANLFGAKLEGAVFDGAILKDTRFGEFAKE